MHVVSTIKKREHLMKNKNRSKDHAREKIILKAEKRNRRFEHRANILVDLYLGYDNKAIKTELHIT